MLTLSEGVLGGIEYRRWFVSLERSQDAVARLRPWLERMSPSSVALGTDGGILHNLGEYSMQIYLLANPLHDLLPLELEPSLGTRLGAVAVSLKVSGLSEVCNV